MLEVKCQGLLRNVGAGLGGVLGRSPPFPLSFLNPSHSELADRHVTLGMCSSQESRQMGLCELQERRKLGWRRQTRSQWMGGGGEATSPPLALLIIQS